MSFLGEGHSPLSEPPPEPEGAGQAGGMAPAKRALDWAGAIPSWGWPGGGRRGPLRLQQCVDSRERRVAQ